MSRGIFTRMLSFAAVCAFAMLASAQVAIQPLRVIHLPVPKSRGSYNHWPIPGLAARDHYSWKVAPDQSVLVLDSDTTGKWPFVRVRRWWTGKPKSETLLIPGWNKTDSTHIDDIRVDLQVTPDGRYAVAFAEALWQAKSNFLIHAPIGYVQHPADTIITIVDLDHWQIVKSIHTRSLGEFQIRDARVANNRWIAFDDLHFNQSPSKYGAYPVTNALISIPDLKLGPECTSQEISHIWQHPPDSVTESIRKQNDQACRRVLKATGIESVKALETLIRRGSGIEPDAMKIHILDTVASAIPGEVNLWTAERHEEDFFKYWGEYPYYENYAENPPFESSLHLWYGLYGAPQSSLYELDRYDAKGQKKKSQTIHHLLCGDPELDSPKSACGCRVIDVSEEQHTLLTYCRRQHGDYDGRIQRQWLSMFRSDDFSGLGLISLPKNSEMLAAIGIGNNHSYVLTLDHGEMLRVYSVPD
jgi:hypothetical protein